MEHPTSQMRAGLYPSCVLGLFSQWAVSLDFPCKGALGEGLGNEVFCPLAVPQPGIAKAQDCSVCCEEHLSCCCLESATVTSHIWNLD